MIRPAVAGDFAAVDEFDPFAGDRAREIVDGRMLVAEVDSRVVGYGSWAPAGFVGRDYITFLCIHPEHRRRGLALVLLRAVEAKVGTGRLFISTEEDNGAMLALLVRGEWTDAGAVAGTNEGNRAEVFTRICPLLEALTVPLAFPPLYRGCRGVGHVPGAPTPAAARTAPRCRPP